MSPAEPFTVAVVAHDEPHLARWSLPAHLAAVLALASGGGWLVASQILATDSRPWQAALGVAVLLPALVHYFNRTFQNFVVAGVAPTDPPGRRCSAPRSSVAIVLPVLIDGAGAIPAVAAFVEHHVRELDEVADRIWILVDFPDSTDSDKHTDEALRKGLEQTLTRVDARRIHLVVRRRRWNPVDGVWTGWERKRGKILQFLRATRGCIEPDFDCEAIRDPALRAVESVLTLDLDSRLMPGALRRLYLTDWGDAAIITPTLLRRGADTPGHFERLYYGKPATAHEAARAPVFHADVVGCPLFFGKGLLHVDRFLQRVDRRLPDNAVLSHDHLEGALAGVRHQRTAVASESDPATWVGWRRRQDRWIRGDIQLLPFILPGGRDHEPIPVLGRLKLASNLVGHAAPVSVLGFAACVWGGLLGPIPGWIGLVAFAAVQPGSLTLPLLDGLGLGRGDRPSAQIVVSRLASSLVQTGIRLSLLVDLSVTTVHAGMVTARRLVLGRDLLRWREPEGPARPWVSLIVALALPATLAGNPAAWTWSCVPMAAWMAGSVLTLRHETRP